MMKRVLPAILLIFVTSCMDDSKYEYVDGNGNRYVITLAVLQYSPVSPAESSSGTYSGGEKMVISLHEVQFQALRKVLDDAIRKTGIHAESRTMGTGLVKRESRGDSGSWIIRSGTTEKQRIEDLLAGFLMPAM